MLSLQPKRTPVPVRHRGVVSAPGAQPQVHSGPTRCSPVMAIGSEFVFGFGLGFG